MWSNIPEIESVLEDLILRNVTYTSAEYPVVHIETHSPTLISNILIENSVLYQIVLASVGSYSIQNVHIYNCKHLSNGYDLHFLDSYEKATFYFDSTSVTMNNITIEDLDLKATDMFYMQGVGEVHLESIEI